jgi:CDP-diglyceride synthetase
VTEILCSALNHFYCNSRIQRSRWYTLGCVSWSFWLMRESIFWNLTEFKENTLPQTRIFWCCLHFCKDYKFFLDNATISTLYTAVTHTNICHIKVCILTAYNGDMKTINHSWEHHIKKMFHLIYRVHSLLYITILWLLKRQITAWYIILYVNFFTFLCEEVSVWPILTCLET